MSPAAIELHQILMEAGYSDWNEADLFLRQQHNPTLPQFMLETWTLLKHKGGMWNCTEPGPKPPKLQFFFTINDLFFFTVVLFASTLLIRLRLRVTPLLTQWAVRCGLKPKDAVKTPECVWKGATHGVLWFVSLYIVVLSGRYKFFHDPCTVWDGIIWNAHLDKAPILPDMCLIYGLQLTHYFHALYATLRFETKRADHTVTLIHHFVTISLLVCSFSMRFFRIGALVLLLHDVSDVLLEVTKLNVYFRVRHGKKQFWNKLFGDIGFIAFACSWGLCRLYWYPVKVLHACGWCGVFRHGCVDPHIFWPFNGLLWLLQLLHIYWFGFILLLVYKIVTGQVREVEDTRESETGHENDDNCYNSNQFLDGSPTENGSLQYMKSYPNSDADEHINHRKTR